MKHFKGFLPLLFIFSILISACSDETSPEEVVELFTEKSVININGREIEKSVTHQITHLAGEIVNEEIVAVSFDGQSLLKSTDGNWTTDIRVGQDGNIPNPVKSELPGLAGAECETEVSCQPIPVPFIHPTTGKWTASSYIVTETACFSVTYENGVMVTTFTYSSSRRRVWGGC